MKFFGDMNIQIHVTPNVGNDFSKQGECDLLQYGLNQKLLFNAKKIPLLYNILSV